MKENFNKNDLVCFSFFGYYYFDIILNCFYYCFKPWTSKLAPHPIEHLDKQACPKPYRTLGQASLPQTNHPWTCFFVHQKLLSSWPQSKFVPNPSPKKSRLASWPHVTFFSSNKESLWFKFKQCNTFSKQIFPRHTAIVVLVLALVHRHVLGGGIVNASGEQGIGIGKYCLQIFFHLSKFLESIVGVQNVPARRNVTLKFSSLLQRLELLLEKHPKRLVAATSMAMNCQIVFEVLPLNFATFQVTADGSSCNHPLIEPVSFGTATHKRQQTNSSFLCYFQIAVRKLWAIAFTPACKPCDFFTKSRHGAWAWKTEFKEVFWTMPSVFFLFTNNFLKLRPASWPQSKLPQTLQPQISGIQWQGRWEIADRASHPPCKIHQGVMSWESVRLRV